MAGTGVQESEAPFISRPMFATMHQRLIALHISSVMILSKIAYALLRPPTSSLVWCNVRVQVSLKVCGEGGCILVEICGERGERVGNW